MYLCLLYFTHLFKVKSTVKVTSWYPMQAQRGGGGTASTYLHPRWALFKVQSERMRH